MPLHDWSKVISNHFFNLQVPWLLSLIDRLNKDLLPKDLYSITQFDFPSTPIALAPPFADWDEWGDRIRSRQHRGEWLQHSAVIRQRKTHQLVAAIEIIRPQNLQSAKAVRAMTSRILKYLQSGIHLLLIDVFPPTEPKQVGFHAGVWKKLGHPPETTAAGQSPQVVSYLIGDTVEAFLHPLVFGVSLGEMPLFLTPTQVVNLPLEETYQHAWSRLPEMIQQDVTGG